jgi:hypothetical protein
MTTLFCGATIALLRGNKLDLAVVHDYDKPNQRLEQLVKDKLIKPKQLLNYAMFRTAGTVLTTGLISSDVEDMISPDKMYPGIRTVK